MSIFVSKTSGRTNRGGRMVGINIERLPVMDPRSSLRKRFPIVKPVLSYVGKLTSMLVFGSSVMRFAFDICTSFDAYSPIESTTAR